MRWALVLLVAASCSNKKEQTGLPPAQEWGADPGSPQPAAPPNPHGGGADVAGAMPAGAMPGGHPSMDEPGMAGPIDPNAPMPPNHPSMDQQPGPVDPSAPLPPGHPAMNGQPGPVDPNTPVPSGHPAVGTDVSQLNLPPPDPNRPIDPTHHIKGVIKVHPKAADRAKDGTAVFLIVKKADSAGQPTGTPLAVEKLTWQKDGIPFELTEKQAMIAGTQLVGDVVITARLDQDGDAISKQSGDITGQMKLTIPADDVKLYLDNILP